MDQGKPASATDLKKNAGVTTLSRDAWQYVVVVCVWLAYVAVTFMTPTSQRSNELFHLTDLQLFLLRVSIAIPYLAIWMLATRSIILLGRYVSSIAETVQGRAFRLMRYGLCALLFNAVVPTVLSTARNYLSPERVQGSSWTIAMNLIYAYLPLLAFLLFFAGSVALLKEVKRSVTLGSFVTSCVLVGGIGMTYLFSIFNNPTRQVSGGADLGASYYMSDAMIIVFIVVPSVISWLLGIIAAFNLYSYSKESTAVIYEKSLPPLTWGVIAIIGSSIVIQLLISLGAARLLGLGLGGILFAIYLFQMLEVIGFLLVARGARRLSLIESMLRKYR